MKRYFATILIGFSGFLRLGTSQASQITLAWDPSPDSSVIGYNIYYGSLSGVYTNVVSALESTSITISNLPAVGVSYIVATAIDSAGLESDFSSEIAVPLVNSALVTLGNLAQTYNGLPKPVSVTTNLLGALVKVTYNGSTTAPSNVGSYQVVASIFGLTLLGSVTNTLIISKASAAVQLSGLSQTFNGAAKAVTATSNPSGLALKVTYNGSTAAPTNAGSYTVVASVNNANYTGSATSTLVISKAAATVALGGLSQTYNGSSKPVSVSTSPAGLATTVKYNGSSTVPGTAGSYSVVAAVNNANYAGTASGTLVIAKAAATVQMGSLGQTYNGTARTVSLATTPSGLAVKLSYSGSTSAPTNAGSYTVVGTINNANYTGAATNTLVVAKASSTVRLSALAQTYNGTARPVSFDTSPAGLKVNFTYNNSSTVPANAGSYTVVGTVNDTNWKGAATNTLVISKAPATVQLSGLTQVYNGTARTVTPTTSPTGLAVKLTYNGQTWAPTNVGNYTVVGTINNANYAGSTTNTLMVSSTVLSLVQTEPQPTKANKGQTQPVAPASGIDKGAGTPAATVSATASPQQRIRVSWSPNTNYLTLFCSSDLATWRPLTNVAGLSGSLVMTQQTDAMFFWATAASQLASNRISVFISPY